MATVGCMEGDNGLSESNSFSGNKVSSTRRMCLRNGINNNCHLDKNSSSISEPKRIKTVKVVRVNGFSKITINPTLPTLSLKTRPERRSNVDVSPDPIIKKRRSPRLERQDQLER